ncbi:MAG: SDR family oxidoreductase [Lachnospiraceae bacterium]|nr:SDR family oxidoreductase [Lachnospiraceae bacterium]
MSLEISLAGKHAIVTGGASGIGAACAEMLARADADVWIADLDEGAAEETAKRLGSQYKVKTGFSRCNVSVKADVCAMVEDGLAAFGGIDIFQHIAGVSKAVEFLDLQEEQYDFIMDINVKGTYLVDQTVLKAMLPNREGKIVNMSSMSGKEAYPTNVAYAASKFAVLGLTQGIAKVAAPYNINVNAVCPGIVRTNIWEKMLQDMRERGDDVDAYWEGRISEIPLHRPQTVEDIAHMALYLSSPLADNMTGQGINVTGGLIMH